MPHGRSLGFMVMGLVSGWSLANRSDSESLLVVHALFSQDGCQREGFCEVVEHVVSQCASPNKMIHKLDIISNHIIKSDLRTR